ncbi:DUF2254 domain-containing protein [Noviherbaspirillum aerium]|uniref:DUF2254 domain-containing protein n=1 Tax=Noviherbaspirillum aerium TaxID=2588497 RepID=UPI00124D49B0|nr:DUF2254 domain-containing protein [Noviherbaspirillum aerium]
MHRTEKTETSNVGTKTRKDGEGLPGGIGTRVRMLQGARVRQAFIAMRSSFWFLPALIVLASMALALGLVELDQHAGKAWMQWNPRWFENDAEGARSILQTIAGSMATVAGVVFSITIVALAQASTQYTTRVLRNFMRDRLNQSMLGIFIGVFLYCLLVMRFINDSFVPSVALLAAVALTILASATFIIFIHHIASSIQASELAKSITLETMAALDTEFPAHGSPNRHPHDSAAPEATWQPLPARDVGYIQTVDVQALIDFACQYDTIVRMECDVGDFVAQGWTMAYIAGTQPASEKMIEYVNHIYVVDSYRTIDQDAAFGFRQLVDISLKALSPGINDTTTAVTCIEHLSALLAYCAPRPVRPPWHVHDGKLRLIAQPRSFDYLVSLAFEQILENAKGNTEILLRLMAAIERIADSLCDIERLQPLREQLDAIAEIIESETKTANSRRRLQERLSAVRQALEEKKGMSPAEVARLRSR